MKALVGLAPMLASLCTATGAEAQLSPDHAYNAANRPLLVRVRTEAAAPRPVRIQLLEPVTARVIDQVTLADESLNSTVDLAKQFPKLWSEHAPRLMYAQLIAGEKKVGPAVVLQPMLAPMYAPRLDRSGAPMYPADKDRTRTYSGVRAYVDKQVVLETSKGDITLGLRPDVAPNTCWNFRQLVDGGLYSDVPFHRIASLAGRKEPDIVQSGDPNGNGQGGPGYFIDLEPSTLPHDFGVVSAARFGDPNSGGSQFMICLNREGTAYMDGRYTSFAQVLEVDKSAEVLRTIAASPVGADNRPTDPPVIRSAKLVDAPPYGEGAKPAKDPLKAEVGR